MILCLDIGNSQVHGGVFNQDGKLVFQFRKNTTNVNSSDEIGVFLKIVLKENDVDPKSIKKISLCTVVPQALHSIRNACFKYFNIRPFVLKAGAKTGLKVRYHNPIEVGSDRIANAIACTHMFPQQNNIIVDLGTATTFCVINKENDYMGGVILPGLKISMKSLESNTAKLPSVQIVPTKFTMGKTTIESIQSGLFWTHVGAIKEITQNLKRDAFKDQDCKIVGTGGFTRLFKELKLFDFVEPNLVLNGLFMALKLNS